jgi:hypothetical protein
MKGISANTFLILWFAWSIPSASTYGMTQIPPDAKVEADQQTILELTSTFDRAEESIRSRDLDSLMALYSEQYRYHGLKKPDIRKIWEELFSHYDLISNIHIFSAIRNIELQGQMKAEITCTGALWATSKNTKDRVPIDSWHQEVHHLVKEKGGWRIVGSTDGQPRPRMFGMAPHPLF